MAITALTLIKGALDLIGVLAGTEAPSANDAQDARRRLNQMVQRYRTNYLTKPFVVREVFDVTANQSTYTIGPDGDFDLDYTPTSLNGAGLLLTGSTPPVEIPRALLTDDAYQAIQVKTLTSQLWTNVYFNPTFSDDLATVFLWPTPTTAENDCVLYLAQPIAQFADLTTEYDLPAGYAEALEYNLAIRLAAPYGRPLTPDVVEMAATALADIKRQNVKLSDLQVDPAVTQNRRGAYNIQTGNY